MASNATTYKNLTPAQPLDKKTLNKMVWRSLNLQGSFNYERMQAAGWLYCILPGLEKIHTDKDDLSISMQHNLEFFNTHPFLVTFVMGIVLSMEQQKMQTLLLSLHSCRLHRSVLRIQNTSQSTQLVTDWKVYIKTMYLVTVWALIRSLRKQQQKKEMA